MTYIEILESHGVVRIGHHLLELVAHLDDNQDYWRDAVLVASADVRLRRELVRHDGPLRLDIVEPDEEDVRLARTAIDCMPTGSHSLLGLHDAFVFGGDLAKWVRFSDRGMEGIAQVARTMGGAVARIQGGAGDADDYARFQTALWAAQLARTLGAVVLGGDAGDDATRTMERALVDLGFYEQYGEAAVASPIPAE